VHSSEGSIFIFLINSAHKTGLGCTPAFFVFHLAGMEPWQPGEEAWQTGGEAWPAGDSEAWQADGEAWQASEEAWQTDGDCSVTTLDLNRKAEECNTARIYD